jgi:cytochrome c oxidase subunit 1
MHFLGLGGKPRRIPDYPDGYAGWNHLMTLGSILTVLSVLLFLYIISNTLFINKKLYISPVRYTKFI